MEQVMSSVERGRGNNKRVLYLNKWRDYPECRDWTEEPFDNFSLGGLEKLQEFHRSNPDVTLGCFTIGTIAQVVTNSLSPLSGQHLYDGSGATV